jgi:hypothetical protein
MPDSARRQKVELLCLEALTKDGERRAAFLDAGCGSDADLRQQVEELLAGQSEAAAFLETPAWAETRPGGSGPRHRSRRSPLSRCCRSRTGRAALRPTSSPRA